WVSKRFWRLLGHDPSAAATLPASRAEFAEPEDLAAAEASLARHLANPDSHYEQTIRYRRIDGSTAWIRSLGFALRDTAGKPTRIIGFDTDATASMRGDKLSGANGYLKDFVYAAAHDLRSPLITISGHLDYVRTRAGEGLEARLCVMLERSIEAAKQMTEYLDTLVRFS